ncbi:hypothetical protein [Halomonas sp. YLGW01]|uniref:hypothetical protein n=1 Tax=Halomonas sp. YLGW01 TaxID=2773308 RepID=UPI0017843C46|nr:hypothetical protein [Halomonas sp. YLGW01]
MKTSRPFLLMILIPVIGTLALAGLIFGGQAMSDSGVDGEIKRALAAELGTSEDIDLQHLQDVQYGYGICGAYKAADGDGYASFYYATTSDRLTLDVNSREYTDNCGLSAIC